MLYELYMLHLHTPSQLILLLEKLGKILHLIGS